jgi:transmembrane 9 superfamily protein 2/4
MVAVIMIRILHRDLARYNTEALSEEEQKEETGWKLIHGDVFRPPKHANWLCILAGTGTQVIAMVLVTLFFAALNFLSPANRGGLTSALLFFFVFLGMLAGYNSTRLYKLFQLDDWKRNTLYTALFFPGVMFTGFFILNLFVWSTKSSMAIPFWWLIALLILWLGISVPLVYFGSYAAMKKPVHEHPCKINNLQRMLPPDSAQSWYASPYLSVLLGGILPFAAVFIEIFFIMSSVWLNQYYHVFYFLFIVFLILAITCAEITIVLCYFQLCNEDYHWWWRSYLTPGSSALYLFLYSILYFCTRLQIVKFVSGLLFFGYMALVSFAFFILTGTIGFYATLAFVTKIYASIKID